MAQIAEVLAGFVTTKLTLVLLVSMTSKEVVLTVGSFLAVRAAQLAQMINSRAKRLAARIMARRLLPSC